MAYTGMNELSKFLKVLKVSPTSHINVVYRIDCKDCDASYVRQAERSK